MTKIQTSRLSVRDDPKAGKGAKRLSISYQTKKGKTLHWSPAPGALSAELSALAIEALDGREVDFELVAGHPDRIRPKGAPWKAPESPVGPARSGGRRHLERQGSGRRGAGAGRPGLQRDRRRPGERRPGIGQAPRARDFHNPYNFVPAPTRARIQGPLGDARPASHQAYLPGHWSGRLGIELTTVTPLLLPDASRSTTNADRHKSFPIRRGPDGGPLLPPTSVKGMLRAAYEAITNSRFGIVERHDAPLGLRMEAREGLSLVPAVVTRSDAATELQLMPGDTGIGDDGRPEGGLMYAAWLPRYRPCRTNTRIGPDKGEGQVALRYKDGALPEHGDRVWVRVEREAHRSGRFSLLRVREIQRADGAREPPAGWRRGIVCVTGRNIMNKHDERVFLDGTDPNVTRPIALPEDIARRWRDLIRNYRAIHEDDLEQRRRDRQAFDDYVGHEPGRTGWSRHIYEDPHTWIDGEQPVLCHARVSRGRGGWLIHALYPVMISRDVFQRAPRELLDDSLRPARAVDKLSPADRVFGWVHPDAGSARGAEPTAWRGQLRVGPVGCEQGAGAIETLAGPGDGRPDGVPLAILGQPKPQQVRFYVAGDQVGNPLADGTRKADGYRDGQGLRGRKFYPHHRHLADWPGYWHAPGQDRTDRPEPRNGRRYHQEYRRPERRGDDGKDQTRDEQNRTITEWVRPDVRFRFDLQLTNLSRVELGALLWLLSLDQGHQLRLGGGKPLGFGSVRVRITDVDLRDGAAWQQDYRHLLGARNAGDPGPDQRIDAADAPIIAACIQAFQQAVIGAYPAATFEQVPFIKAFLIASRGFADALPIHYPRVDQAPNPEGKNFLWFTANDSRFGLCLTLPALHLGDTGLPLQPKAD